MKATLSRLDTYYEVTFARPAFSRLGSFAQIIEPLHDALSVGNTIPSDAIALENGNTISSAVVTASLFHGYWTFEARLDGYKAHFLDLRSRAAIDSAKQSASLFENAVSSFLSDGIPTSWRLVVPFWLKLEGGMNAADIIIRHLTWLPDCNDPFGIGSTSVSSQVKFHCFNPGQSWAIGVSLDKSVLPDSHLFCEISGGYKPGAQFDSLDKKAEHIDAIFRQVCYKIDLEMEDSFP